MSDMQRLPIITLEVERMAYTVKTLLMKHHLEIDEYIQNALDSIVQPEYIQEMVNKTVVETLHSVLQEEITTFFHYGKGNIAIRQLVRTFLHLSKEDPDGDS